MTWHIWQNISANDYMDIFFIEMGYANQLYVKNQLETYYFVEPTLAFVDTSGGIYTLPVPDYLNLVENNLLTLVQSVSWNTGHQITRIWLGENMDEPTFKFSDVNRWFETLEKLKQSLDFVQKPKRISGTFTSGTRRIRQLIRRR